ncbi:MAG: indolepyruvate oxidoreductase subunit beta [archaeon]|nr:indolepyruvate oxidoreductase subunit beta [archaeon]
MKECNIVIAGVGGQGVLLTAEILGNSALKEGYDVRVSEIHGMAQRGGSVVCDVRIGKRVYAPTTPDGMADIMLGLEPIETLRYLRFTSPQTLIIMNTRIVEPVSVLMGMAKNLTLSDITQIIHRFYDHAITIDVMELAMKAGSPIVQNIVILGVLASTKKLPINVNTLKESIKQHVSPKYFELNIKALELGLKAGESYLSFRR